MKKRWLIDICVNGNQSRTELPEADALKRYDRLVMDACMSPYSLSEREEKTIELHYEDETGESHPFKGWTHHNHPDAPDLDDED